jgi:hypothetical protein
MSDTESIASLEECLVTLREQSASVERLFEETQEHFHKFRKRIDDTPRDSLAEVTLKAKPVLHDWLTKRGLPTSLSFQEFFAEFLKEHAKEHRLDLSDRSIALNADAAALIRNEGPIDLLDFMLYVPVLFE